MAETKFAQEKQENDPSKDIAAIILYEDGQSAPGDQVHSNPRTVWNDSSPCSETSSSEEDEEKQGNYTQDVAAGNELKSNDGDSTASSIGFRTSVEQPILSTYSSLGSDTPHTAVNEVDKRGNPAACIFVASLTKEKNDEELNVSVSNHFAQWGVLLNVKVLKDWMGRPYAFVQYERTVDAAQALREAPGTILDGRSIRCEPARVNRTLCLIALDHPLKKEELCAELSVFGSIEDVTLIQPRGRNHCAFVKYNYRDDAIKAFLMLRTPQHVHRWCIEWASNLDMGSSDIGLVRTDKTSAFVGNLCDTVTDDSMYSRFGQYGTIVYLRVIRKPMQHGRKRVFAFVKYSLEQEAATAIERENGELWADRVLRVAYREHHDSISSFFRGGGRRQQYFERPHPPGLGFPASIYQYLSIGRPPEDASSTTPASISAPHPTTDPASMLDSAEATVPALGVRQDHSSSSKSSNESQNDLSGCTAAIVNQPRNYTVPMTTLSCPNTRSFVPGRPIPTTMPAYPYHGTTYYDVCASVMQRPLNDGIGHHGNKNQGPAETKNNSNDAVAYVSPPAPLYDYYSYYPVTGYYPAPPPSCESYYDPYNRYPLGYMYPAPPPLSTSYAATQPAPLSHPAKYATDEPAKQGQGPQSVANGSKDKKA